MAHLATADQYARPRAVPIVFVWLDPHLYTPLDDKPKSVAWSELGRARDIAATGRASVVVDLYDEDWSRLAWVRVDGTAEILEDGAERERAAAALTAKYPQYRDLPLDGRPIIRLTAERVIEWQA